MVGSEDERVSAMLVVDAENEQPDTSSLPAAADTLGYSLQTKIHRNLTLPLQSNGTPPLVLTSPMTNHYLMYTSRAVLQINGNLKEMAS